MTETSDTPSSPARLFFQRTLHGDPGRGATPLQRVTVDGNAVIITGLAALDGAWKLLAVSGTAEDRQWVSWAGTIDRDGAVAELTVDLVGRVAKLATDESSVELPFTTPPVPEWLLGRWRVDTSRLDDAERARLGDGIVEVDADAFSHHGFAAAASIFNQSWEEVRVHAGFDGDSLCLEYSFIADEAWLIVRERDGDRILVRLGGVGALAWGSDIPLIREEP